MRPLAQKTEKQKLNCKIQYTLGDQVSASSSPKMEKGRDDSVTSIRETHKYYLTNNSFYARVSRHFLKNNIVYSAQQTAWNLLK